jgi:hypothetical protein
MAAVRIVVAHPLLVQGQGDEGNALVLAHRAARRGIVAETVTHHGPGRLPAADIYLLGGAEDAGLPALAEALHAGGLARAIHAGAVVLAVDAAFQVLCRAFVSADGVTRDGVGVFGAVSRRAASPAEGPVITRPNARLRLPAMSGFESHHGRTEPDPGMEPLAEIELGVGNGTAPATDGAVAGNAVGTYLHGPVLARNPELADLLLARAIGRDLEPLAPGAAESLRAQRIAEDRRDPTGWGGRSYGRTSFLERLRRA